MALVKFGGGILDASGSIGGNTFSHNRFGRYIRARVKPVNPRSSRQLAARMTIMMLTESWHEDLNDAQRLAWETYAAAIDWNNALGEVVHLTGFNHFVRTNAARDRAGATIILDGPTVLSLPSIDNGFAVTASAAAAKISVAFDGTDDWDDEADTHMLIHMGVPQLHTRNFFNGPWRYTAELVGQVGVDPTSPQLFDPAWTLVEGQKIWAFHLIARADGRLSNRGGAAPFIVAA